LLSLINGLLANSLVNPANEALHFGLPGTVSLAPHQTLPISL